MCAKEFKSEHDDWKLIQRIKDEKAGPYLERVQTAKFLRSTHETQLARVEHGKK